MMDSHDDVFENQLDSIQPRKKIDVVMKLTDELQRIREDIRTIQVRTPEEVETYWQVLRSIYMSFQNQISEVETDIVMEFKDTPEFAEIFRNTKWVTEDEKKKDPRMKYYKMWLQSKEDLMEAKKRILNLEAKNLSINSFLRDIFYEGLEKLMGVVRRRGSVVVERVDTSDVRLKGRLMAIEALINHVPRVDIAKKYSVGTDNVRLAEKYWTPKFKAEGLIKIEDNEILPVIQKNTFTEIPKEKPEKEPEKTREQPQTVNGT